MLVPRGTRHITHESILNGLQAMDVCGTCVQSRLVFEGELATLIEEEVEAAHGKEGAPNEIFEA